MKTTLLPIFYERIVERLNNKKNDLNLTYKKISTFENNNTLNLDEKMLNNIFKNKIHKKKNPYLMSDTFIEELTMRLQFESKLELLWGICEYNENYKKNKHNNNADDEITKNNKNDIEFTFYFYCICDFILQDFHKKTIPSLSHVASTLDLVLSDYIPYAKNSALLNFITNSETTSIVKLEGTNFHIKNYFNVHTEFTHSPKLNTSLDPNLDRNKLLEERKKILIPALNILLWKCEDEFKSIFYNFIENHGYSLKKLDKHLLNFINNDFLNLIDNYIPNETSLGLRAKHILLSDWYLKINSENYSDKELYTYSIEYIDKLEKIQHKSLTNLNIF